MKRNADAKRREIQLEVGDRVLSSTRHLKVAVAGAAKFKPRLVGPFEVIMKNGTVAYKLKLPETMSKLHPWFHVSLLRPYNDGGRVDLVPPPAVIVEMTRLSTSLRRSFLTETWPMMGLSILSSGLDMEYTWLARSAVEDTVALDLYLDGLEGKIRPSSRMTSSVKKPAPTWTSARLRKRKI